MFTNTKIIFFFLQDTVPPYTYTDAPHIGNGFQGKVDTMIMSYQQTLDALNSSTNRHTKLEGIFQTFEGTNETYHVHWRRPTQAEIWLQAFVAISRNAKGIHSYVYRSHHYGGISYETGLIDSLTRNPNQPTYDYVANLYTHLSVLGPRILNLDVNEAFTWDDSKHQYIQKIEGDTADGSHGTIEVAIFDPAYASKIEGDYNYFMLINRRCNRDSSSVWVNAFPQHISLTLDTTLTGSYKIRDLYSDEIFVANNHTFEDIELLAGRGRVFELTQAYPCDISGMVYYYNQARAVSDAIMSLVCGSGKPADTTDVDGNFEFADMLPGNAHLTPSKEDDLRDAISGSDALLVMRYLAFLATLTEDQQFAADVTEDGSVSGSDAQARLRKQWQNRFAETTDGTIIITYSRPL